MTEHEFMASESFIDLMSEEFLKSWMLYDASFPPEQLLLGSDGFAAYCGAPV